MSKQKETTESTVVSKRKCCNCNEYSITNLQLDNGDYICESCAQIMSDLSNF